MKYLTSKSHPSSAVTCMKRFRNYEMTRSAAKPRTQNLTDTAVLVVVPFWFKHSFFSACLGPVPSELRSSSQEHQVKASSQHLRCVCMCMYVFCGSFSLISFNCSLLRLPFGSQQKAALTYFLCILEKQFSKQDCFRKVID